jgi:hypothetical protein
MCHGRWRSATVMRGYVDEGVLWTDNAAPLAEQRTSRPSVSLRK